MDRYTTRAKEIAIICIH